MKITIEITDIQIACIKAHIDDLAQNAITAAEFNLAQIAYQIESEYDRKIRRMDSKQNPIIYGDSEAKSPTMESTNTVEPSTTSNQETTKSNAERSKKSTKSTT